MERHGSCESEIFKEVSIFKDGTEAKIMPKLGALTISFTVDNVNIFYLDRNTLNGTSEDIRGGIPVLFPNAGPLKGEFYNLPQHGFARDMSWSEIEKTNEAIVLKLLSDKETMREYPFNFELNLKLEVSREALRHSMKIKNENDKSMPIAYGIHPYFEINDSEKQKIIIENIGGLNSQKVDWSKAFDVPFINPGKIRMILPENDNSPKKEIVIESDPDKFKFVYIWHEVGKNFICVEPWTRNDYALDNKEESCWIASGDSAIFPVNISAKT